MTYSVEACIIDMIDSMGPQDFDAILYECNTQCNCTIQTVKNTLVELITENKIVKEENDDGTNYYDFPDSYYFP